LASFFPEQTCTASFSSSSGVERATLLTSTVRREARGPPSRAQQVREEVSRKNSLWRFAAKRHFSPAPFGGEAQGPPSRLHQAQNETDQERRTLAVWSEATFLSSTVRGEARGPPSRAHQEQKQEARKNAV